MPPPQVRALSCISLPTLHTILSQLPTQCGVQFQGLPDEAVHLAEKSGQGPQLPNTEAGTLCQTAMTPSILV